MKRVAQALDALVGKLATLQSISALAQTVSTADLNKLLKASSDPKIQARANKHQAEMEFFRTLIAGAVKELEDIAALADVDAEFPELVEPAVKVPALPSGDSAAPGEPEMETSGETTVTTPPESEVSVEISGDAVQVVNGDDGRIHVVLPDNSVMTLSEASVKDRVRARRARRAGKTSILTTAAKSKNDAEVEVEISGDVTDIITGSAGQIFAIFTDNSVMTLSEATPEDTTSVLAKLQTV